MATRRLDFRWPLLAHPLAIALGVIILLGLLRAAYEIRTVLLLGFLAVLLATVFSFPVRLLQKVMPRGLAVLATLLVTVGVAVGMGMIAVPVVQKQVAALMTKAPEGIRKAQAWATGRDRSSPVAQLPQKQKVAEKVDDRIGEAAGSAAANILPAAMTVSEGVMTGVLLLVLSLFLVHEPDVYRRGLRLLVPREHEETFDEAWRRLGHDLRKWVGGITVSMVLMGLVCAVGLALAGIDGWVVLALLTFFGTFIPYAGALASAVPGLLVALAQSSHHFLAACAVYLVVHLVEGYIVEPQVMKRAVAVRPALLLFGQACLGAIFGVVGIVVATPLIVVGQALVQYLWVERRLGKVAVVEG
jgi:predicted PurR-regulated permease PerM